MKLKDKFTMGENMNKLKNKTKSQEPELPEYIKIIKRIVKESEEKKNEQ